MLAPGLKPWSPPGLGLPRALLVGLLIEVLISMGLLSRWHDTSAPAPTMAQQVTTVDFVNLPSPSLSKPAPVRRIWPRSVPRPDIVIPKQARPTPRVDRKRKPVAKPKRIRHVIHHERKSASKARAKHHVVNHEAVRKPKPAPPSQVASHRAPQVIKAPAPGVARKSGPTPSAIAAYSQALHVLIQNNVRVGGTVRELGLSGSVRVSFVLGPNGGKARHVHVISSGANPLIRRDALKTISQLSYPPFPAVFGSAARTFAVVVRIKAGD